jgi:hypothetical protein
MRDVHTGELRMTESPDDKVSEPLAETAEAKPNPDVKPPPYGWFTHGYDPSKPNFKGGDEPDGKERDGSPSNSARR